MQTRLERGISCGRAYPGNGLRRKFLDTLETMLREDFARELEERKERLFDEYRDRLNHAYVEKVTG